MTENDGPRDRSPGDTARAVMRTADRAVLSTALAADSWPYGSLVLTALDHAATPLLLISRLAEHTANLGRDDRASLLFDGTGGFARPLEGPRLTVLGRVARSEDAADRRRYLARHPDAALYADFEDFAVYRVDVERAHLVAGFGAIHWLAAGDLRVDTVACTGLIAAEAEIVAHMNDDHADAVAACAHGLLGLPGDGWTITGVDGEGCDLRRGGAIARLPFGRPVTDAATARAELVQLFKRARRGGTDT